MNNNNGFALLIVLISVLIVILLVFMKNGIFDRTKNGLRNDKQNSETVDKELKELQNNMNNYNKQIKNNLK